MVPSSSMINISFANRNYLQTDAAGGQPQRKDARLGWLATCGPIIRPGCLVHQVAPEPGKLTRAHNDYIMSELLQAVCGGDQGKLDEVQV